MTFEARSFDHLLDLPGFGRDAMEDHIGLYEGYVDATNHLTGRLSANDLDGRIAAELRRRLGWEFNGMRLHEHWFDTLRADPTPLGATPMQDVLDSAFGSAAIWRREFDAVAKNRGAGWVALVRDPVSGALVNTWLDDHDAGLLHGTHTLLLIDLFEHAYMRDFGTDRDAYLDAVHACVDWERVAERHQASASLEAPQTQLIA